MSSYNWKSIAPIPTADGFVDIVLSRTQRKTPTEVHKGYNINRIRSFYMRKVKFCQQTCHDKLSEIIDKFPRLDDIHPFYADLINVLYDRDHYKIALGSLNQAMGLIDGISKDYVRLMKYGDSLYRCKALKRAALGRMVTVLKKLKASLGYLEHVRQHLSRLPAIDPTERTIIVCGYPNVGKSSAMNKWTRADVEVQPYPFTTKSLFLGHMDYRFVRWQVLDTPGILDRPLEERNTIEMVAITALAHLRAAVLYFVDISEQCGHSIQAQLDLFRSISPLFSNKPLMVVCTKTDVIKPEELPAEKRALFDELRAKGVAVGQMSTLQEVGVMDVRNAVCDMLLAQRNDKTMRSAHFRTVLNRLHVATPQARDQRERPAVVPASVVDKKSGLVPRPERQVQRPANPADWGKQANFDPSDYSAFDPDLRAKYLLANPEWRYDVIPEMIDGHNVIDFIDPDIDRMLEELEREEAEQQAQFEKEMEGQDLDVDEEDLELIAQFHRKRNLSRLARSEKKTRALPQRRAIPVDSLKDAFVHAGMDEDEADQRAHMRARSNSRGRELVREDRARKRSRSNSTGREAAKSRSLGSEDARKKVKQMEKASKIHRNREGRKGEGDHVILNEKPKHLFAGKSGFKRDRR